RIHAIYLPAILVALKLPLLVHANRTMSKSLGNVMGLMRAMDDCDVNVVHLYFASLGSRSRDDINIIPPRGPVHML
ncbi:hypothetical protein EDD16DRAFT_1501718, partial [Pisolithus croceorrhizus]